MPEDRYILQVTDAEGNVRPTAIDRESKIVRNWDELQDRFGRYGDVVVGKAYDIDKNDDAAFDPDGEYTLNVTDADGNVRSSAVRGRQITKNRGELDERFGADNWSLDPVYRRVRPRYNPETLEVEGFDDWREPTPLEDWADRNGAEYRRLGAYLEGDGNPDDIDYSKNKSRRETLGRELEGIRRREELRREVDSAPTEERDRLAEFDRRYGEEMDFLERGLRTFAKKDDQRGLYERYKDSGVTPLERRDALRAERRRLVEELAQSGDVSARRTLVLHDAESLGERISEEWGRYTPATTVASDQPVTTWSDKDTGEDATERVRKLNAAANYLVRDTKRTVSSDSTVKGAAKNVLSDPETYFDFINVDSKVVLRGLLEKVCKMAEEGEPLSELPEEDRLLYEAWRQNLDAHALMDPLRGRAYNATQGAINSAFFMAKLAVSGGFIRAAEEEMLVRFLERGLLKGVSKEAGMTLTEGLVKAATKNIGSKALRFGAETGVKLGMSVPEAAVETILNPGMLSRSLGNELIRFDDDGNLPSLGRALLNTGLDTYAELISERGFEPLWGLLTEVPAGLVGAGLRRTLPGAYGKMAEFYTKANASTVVKMMRQGGWNGLPEEMAEEAYGDAIRTITGYDRNALRDCLTWDNQLTTFYSFLPITMIGGTTSMYQVGRAERNYRNARNALEGMLGEVGYDGAQTALALDSILSDPVNGRSGIVEAIFAKAETEGRDRLTGDEMRLLKAVEEYNAAAAAKAVYDGAWESQQNAQRREEYSDMVREYGGDFTIDGGAAGGAASAEADALREASEDGETVSEEDADALSEERRVQDRIDNGHVAVVSTLGSDGAPRRWFVVGDRTESGEYAVMPADPREAAKARGRGQNPVTFIGEGDIVKGRRRDGDGRVTEMTAEETVAAATVPLKDFINERLMFNREQRERARVEGERNAVRAERARIAQEEAKRFRTEDGSWEGEVADGWNAVNPQINTEEGLQAEDGRGNLRFFTWDEIYSRNHNGEAMPTEGDVERREEERREVESGRADDERTALERIPKDRDGNPMFERAESPAHAWDALVEAAGDDEETARGVAQGMLADRKRDVEKAEKAARKPPEGRTAMEKIAAAKAARERTDALRKERDFWQGVVDESSGKSRPAPVETAQNANPVPAQQSVQTPRTAQPVQNIRTPKAEAPSKAEERPKREAAPAGKEDERFGRMRLDGGLVTEAEERLNRKLAPEQVERLHLESFTGNDEYSPTMSCIYYKDGYAYASDQHILIKARIDYPAEWEGKMINPKTGKEEEGRYPDADRVLTNMLSVEDVVRVRPQELLDALGTAAEVKKGGRKSKNKKFAEAVYVAAETAPTPLVINRGDEPMLYRTAIVNADYSKQIESMMKACGDVGIYTSGTSVRFVGDGAEAVLMGMLNGFEGRTAAVAYNGRAYLGEEVSRRMTEEAERLRKEAEGLFGKPKERNMEEADRIERVVAEAGTMVEFRRHDLIGKAERERTETQRQSEAQEKPEVPQEQTTVQEQTMNTERETQETERTETTETQGQEEGTRETDAVEGATGMTYGDIASRWGEGMAEYVRFIADKAREWNLPCRILMTRGELEDTAVRVGATLPPSEDYLINGFTKGGTVYLYAPDLFSSSRSGAMREDRAMKTLFHEGLAHLGMRAMMGEEGYDRFCDEVFEDCMDGREREREFSYHWNVNMKAGERRAALGLEGDAEAPAWDGLTDGQRKELMSGKSEAGRAIRRGAADEYIAKLAEKMEAGETVWSGTEKTVWMAILAWIKKLFKTNNRPLSDRSIANTILEVRRRAESGELFTGRRQEGNVENTQTETAETQQETQTENKETAPSSTEVKKVNVEGVFNDLYKKGRTKLSDHTEEVRTESKEKGRETTEKKETTATPANGGQFGLVSDERMEELRSRLRAKLNGQLNSGFDPEILSIGLELAAGYIDRGIRSFADFAKRMLADLGDAVRPYLKAFYNGARDLPQITESGLDREMSSYEEVSAADLDNIGNETEENTQENGNRRETDAGAADGEAAADEGEAFADEAERRVKAAKTEGELQEVIEETDRQLERVEAALARLRQRYDTDPDAPENEAYGRMRSAERKAKRDATEVFRRLAEDIDVPGSLLRDGKGKPVPLVWTSFSPTLGDVVITLPLGEGARVRIYLDYEVVQGSDGDIRNTGGFVRWERDTGERYGNDQHLTGGETYKDLLKLVRRAAETVRPDIGEAESGERGRKSENNSITSRKEEKTSDNGLQRPATVRPAGNGENGEQQEGLREGGEGGEEGAQQAGGRAPDGRGVRGGSGEDRSLPSGLSGLIRNTNNNRSERGEDHAPKSEDARIEANIAAIELAQRLTESGERATPEQMETLRKFSGWGGLGRAFKETSFPHNPIPSRLRELLGEEGYQEAVMSANSGYYTPAAVIDTLWDIAQGLGFKGGRILEGSAGIGKILGQMPSDISANSDIHAVEIDRTTGMILSLLYPDAKVDVQGFEATRVPNGSVDLAITNVPFVTGLRVDDTSGDRDLSRKFHNIHDFCIAKNIRKLRPGGIGIFITSNGTLDNSKSLRDWIVGDGDSDVIGAFRLNNRTFGGTSVTSDIIVVRKRRDGRRVADAIDVSVVSEERRTEYTDWSKGKKAEAKTMPMVYNKHFIDHPEMMGGRMMFGFENEDTFRPESKGLYPAQGIDQKARLEEFARSFREQDWTREEEGGTAVPEGNSEGRRVGEMFVKDGQLVVADADGSTPLNVNSNRVRGHTKEECFKAYSEIKDALAEALEYQTRNEGDEGLKPLLDRLNKAFDGFVGTYGHLSGNTAISFLRNDVDFPNVATLETRSEAVDRATGEKSVTYGKSDVMTRRVVENTATPTPENVTDGVVASVFRYGRIDLPFIADSLGRDEVSVKEEIIGSGLGFEDPSTLNVVPAFQYLSGNVRDKLRQAEANNENGAYDANIRELRKVIPMNIPAHLIEFNLGSSWMEPSLYAEYVKDKTGVDVRFASYGGTWVMDTITGKWAVERSEKNRAAGVRSERLDKWVLGTDLIEAAIQDRTVSVSQSRKDRYTGKSETVTDREATMAANNKIDEIRQDFRDWMRERMQKDPDLSVRMETKYNDEFNNYVSMEIPDAFVPEWFPGASHKDRMREHQGKAIVRGTMQSLFLSHEVGTGKTYTLISTAMELRRLGLARKPMIVVQNSTVGQFVSSAKSLYPNAKILTLEETDRTPEGRKAFYAKIRYNDWDMVVIPQSAFDTIPDSEERQRTYIQDRIDEKVRVLEQMRAADKGGKSMATRQAERELASLQSDLAKVGAEEATTAAQEKRKAVAKQNAEVRAKEMLDRKTDEVRNFDEMGVDALFVDEAHEYKHLGFSTAMQRGVKGVDPSYSKKAQGLYLKVKAVQERNNGRNVVFATGTPVSNTAAELWTFMRYLMDEDTLKDYGIYYFDDFVRNFGNIQQMLEFTTAGKFRENNRFAGYVNLPELMRIWTGVADIVKTDEAAEVQSRIPEMETGAAQDIYLPQTQSLRAVMKSVRKVLEDYEKMSGPQKKENSHIPLVQYGIAKAAAVDTRLVMDNAPDERDSKTNRAVEETLRSLRETEPYRGTVAIFADAYQNKKTGFNLYEDIKSKLMKAGVPAEEIVIMRSGMTVRQKEEIFDKVNDGRVRVILGSTFTLGTGVNIQERLHTLIHLDAPNRPMDYTQRNGRMLRQGNLHKDWGIPVRILRFGVEDSLDVTAYQRLKTKGSIADSVMNGKRLIQNNMEDRVLEEEEDVFGDTVAQLSGSEYAMLKNSAEKEVRKYEGRRRQWEADQTYIHNHKPELQGRLARTEETVKEAREGLERVKEAFPNGKAGEITADGKRYGSAEEMKELFTEHNRETQERLQNMKRNPSAPGTTSTVAISAGGLTFRVRTEVKREAVSANGGGLIYEAHRRMTYSCGELGLENVDVKGGLLRVAVEDIVNNVATGKVLQDRIDSGEQRATRLREEIGQLESREGKPFEFGKELADAREKYREYAELMKKEMEEKERKYAEMDRDIEEAEGITEAEEEEEMEETPQRYSAEERVSEAERRTETFPTEGQKEAGNYRKGHVTVNGFRVTIENPKGSVRRGTSPDGTEWESVMHNTYGELRGTEGVDGDPVDVFLSNDIDGWDGRRVFVIDQYSPDGTFDEHKVMLGYNGIADAWRDYLSNYEGGWEDGRRLDVYETSTKEFRDWLSSSHRKTKPFGDYSSVTKLTDDTLFPEEEGWRSDEAEELSNAGTRFSVTPKDEIPKRTMTGYKAFHLIDGRLYPPMVNPETGRATEVGVWLTAEEAPVVKIVNGRKKVKSTRGGTLAYRPGWHLGRIPYAIQFNLNDPETGTGKGSVNGLVPAQLVWAEVEYDADRDYSEEAYNKGFVPKKDGTMGKWRHQFASLDYMPVGGYYEYRTNANPATDDWIITDKMRVNRILTDEEVDELVRGSWKDGEGNPVLDAQHKNRPMSETHPVQRREARDNQERRDKWIEELNRQIGEKQSEETADQKETVSDIENPENDTRFSARARAETADEARERFGVELTPDDLASTSTKHGAMMKALRIATENGDIPGMDSDDLITFLADTYRTAPEEVKSGIWEVFNESAVPDLGREIEFALGEYVSREVRGTGLTDAQKTFLDNAAKAVADRLNISEDNAKYVLWQHATADDGLVTDAERLAMRNALGVTTPASDWEGGVQSEMRFSAAERGRTASAAEYYEGRMRDWRRALKEEGYNEYSALDEMCDAVAMQTGRPVEGWENPSYAFNQLSSRTMAEMNAYMRKYLEPMWDALTDICGACNLRMEDVVEYVSLKHGLERNRVFGEREAKAAEESGKRPPKRRDWSGITAWMREHGEPGELKTVEEAEAAAGRIVADYERQLGERADRLWERIRAATGAALRAELTGGLISRGQYDEIRSMFTHYIPLQGFNGDTNEDRYEYFGTWYAGRTGSLHRKAKGRTSRATNPFSTIAMQAQNAIVQSQRNRAKAVLYQFLSARRGNDLTTMGSVWYVRTNRTDPNGNEIWEVSAPAFAEGDSMETMERKIREWNEEMARLAEAGVAVSEANRFTLGRGVAFTFPKDISQHCIDVFINGRRERVFVKGSPRAAQAVNGQIDGQPTFGKGNWFSDLVVDFTRFLASAYTSNNPEFFVTNFARDVQYGAVNTASKERGAYTGRFVRNIGRALQIGVLSRRFRNGTLDTDREAHRMYEEFAMNGGITGYSQMRDDEQYERLIQNYVEGRGKWLKDMLKAPYRAFRRITENGENLSRFAAYMTSRELGGGVQESVAAAKDVTVNFNRKGTGYVISRKEAERLLPNNGVGRLLLRSASAVIGCRPLWAFFNVAVQGVAQLAKNVVEHPAKAVGFCASYYAMGLLNGIIHGAADGLFGGDPPEADDWYWNLSDYERRNNIIIPLGGGRYIKIPMPQELRVFYALGDMTAGAMAHKTAQKNLVYEFMDSVGEAMPVNPFGDGGVVQSLTPTIAVPLVDVALNTDYRGGRIIPETYGSARPKWKAAYSGTADWAVTVSRALNGWNRGSSSGWRDVPPEAIQHLVEGYLGGMFAFANRVYMTGKSAVTGEELNMRNVPFVNRFYGRSQDRRTGAYLLEMNSYAKDTYNSAKAEIEGFRERRDAEGLREFAKTRDYRIYALYSGYADAVSELGRRIVAAPDERTRKGVIDSRNALLTELARRMEDILYE